MIFLTGNVTKGISRFDSTEYSAKRDFIVNNEKIVKSQNCKSFYAVAQIQTIGCTIAFIHK